MANEIIQNNNSEIIQKLVLQGDLSKMNEMQKVQYYNSFCQSLGLNPLTQPFQLITFQGKQRLYATKDCTEQLRKIHGVSITDVTAQELRGVYVVTAKAQDKTGKTDAATGVVSIENLKGENLANALMKAETKAKRRVTLSICGLGILDESETDSVGPAVMEPVAKISIKEAKSRNEEIKAAITDLLDCQSVEDLKQLKSDLPDYVRQNESFKEAAIQRYNELTAQIETE